jgi:hypothetical protein
MTAFSRLHGPPLTRRTRMKMSARKAQRLALSVQMAKGHHPWFPWLIQICKICVIYDANKG